MLWKKCGVLTSLVVFSVCLLPGTGYAQDVTVGGDARLFAMGGAGLALPHRGGMRVNPASLAFERAFLGYSLPSFGVRTRGPFDVSDVDDYDDLDDENEWVGEVLRDFARENTSVFVNASTALRLGPVELSNYTFGQARLEPNPILQNWARTAPAGSTAVPLGARSDLFGFGYSQTSVSFGAQVPVALLSSVPGVPDLPAGISPLRLLPKNLAVGGRLKYVNAAYTHYIADESVLNNPNGEAFLAPELDGRDYRDASGVGFDLGVLARPADNRGLSFALVIANLIRPNISFDGTDAIGNNVNYSPFKTTLSVGAGLEFDQTAVALDIVDIGGSVTDPDIRLGGEQRFFQWLALRGGYSTQNGFSAGIGLGGFGVAFGNRQSVEAVQTVRF